MYKILKKKVLNSQMTLFEIQAPYVAKNAKAGQFIILRVDETGERIPLTIADSNKETGSVTIIFQTVGTTTAKLSLLKENDYIMDFVGPLGKASEIEGYKNVAVIGGGAGCAIAYPQAKAAKKLGAKVTMIAGFRNTDLIILEDEMRNESTELIIMTDDGSNGNKGFVTNALEDKIKSGETFDLVIAIGPLPMMKAVSELTKKYNIKTIISMNSLMIDGTGMCGCCRVTVNGKTKFACIDGPDFDGHEVDYDEAMARSRTYSEEEKKSYEKHKCNLTGGYCNG